MPYRRDIDGLRALAILSVLLFHLEFPGFSGGWVGVDIFFVISGYLITQNIIALIIKGQFSFATFLAGRARRLFPSYLIVIALTLIAAYYIFDRAYLKNVAGEALASSLGLANLYFWRDGDYFNLANRLRPLLHLWSLGVEMQFYLIWPFLLLITIKNAKKFLPLMVISIFLASLLLAEYFSGGSTEATFFLPQFRIFEFATGALLVFFEPYLKITTWMETLFESLGFGLIAYAIIFFDQNTPYPSFYALIPCFGTLMLLMSECKKSFGILINNQLMAAIGKISYCLYLVHWPIIVFFLYRHVTPFSLREKMFILVLSFLLAIVLHTYIEIPIWKRQIFTKLSNEKIALTCCALTLIVITPSAIIWSKGGLSWQGPTLELDRIEIGSILSRQARNFQNKTLNVIQFSGEPQTKKLLFLGDSHGPDLGAAFLENSDPNRYEIATLSFDDACFSNLDRRNLLQKALNKPNNCQTEKLALTNSPLVKKASAIFIANYWSAKSLEGLSDGITFLKANTSVPIYLVGQNAIFPGLDTSLMYLSNMDKEKLNKFFYDHQSMSDIEANQQLKKLADDNGLIFIDRQAIVCDASKNTCLIYDANGQPYYLDSHHWTALGRKRFGEELIKFLPQ